MLHSLSTWLTLPVSSPTTKQRPVITNITTASPCTSDHCASVMDESCSTVCGARLGRLADRRHVEVGHPHGRHCGPSEVVRPFARQRRLGAAHFAEAAEQVDRG